MQTITAILTVYNRPYTFDEQYEAIMNQSVPPNEVMVWVNKGNPNELDFSKYDAKVINCNTNFKFHGRFAGALLARSDYVAIFDDDTIPGEHWFKNCLHTISYTNGILGSIGVRLHSPDYYNPHEKFGWLTKNEKVEEVDLVGHAWFFRKELAKYMWYEEPVSWENGEDMQFSYLCQKYGNIPTHVPSHPAGDRSLWGSVKGEIGHDSAATYLHDHTHGGLRNKIVNQCVQNGWNPICTREI